MSLDYSKLNWDEIFNKPVCQLDENGIFLHETTADLDVYAKDGTYLIPAHCVDTAPPKAKKGFVAKWLSEKQVWEYVQDFRGQTVYNKNTGEPIVVSHLGELYGYMTLQAPPSPFHKWKDVAWELDEKEQEQAMQDKLQEAKSTKMIELNRVAQSFVNQVTGADQLPEFEKDTWTIQAQEARTWAADNTAATPILDRIALERDISVDELKHKVLEKAQQSDMIVATVVGQRQALQTQIEHAKNIDELSAIEIAFHLPELK